jgi:hypothetical protein
MQLKKAARAQKGRRKCQERGVYAASMYELDSRFILYSTFAVILAQSRSKLHAPVAFNCMLPAKRKSYGGFVR